MVYIYTVYKQLIPTYKNTYIWQNNNNNLYVLMFNIYSIEYLMIFILWLVMFWKLTLILDTTFYLVLQLINVFVPRSSFSFYIYLVWYMNAAINAMNRSHRHAWECLQNVAMSMFISLSQIFTLKAVRSVYNVTYLRWVPCEHHYSYACFYFLLNQSEHVQS